MTRNSLQHVTNGDELAVHCWENEGGSLLGGAHLQCNQQRSATNAIDHAPKVDAPPKLPLADRRAQLRRSRPAHWTWPRDYLSDSQRFARRWLPRLRRKRKSRHALERTPLGLMG